MPESLDLDAIEARANAATETNCSICQQPIGWIDCPTGGWWAHAEHPADGHDAFPPNGGHDDSCAYVGGISSRCTCA